LCRDCRSRTARLWHTTNHRRLFVALLSLCPHARRLDAASSRLCPLSRSWVFFLRNRVSSSRIAAFCRCRVGRCRQACESVNVGELKLSFHWWQGLSVLSKETLQRNGHRCVICTAV